MTPDACMESSNDMLAETPPGRMEESGALRGASLSDDIKGPEG